MQLGMRTGEERGAPHKRGGWFQGHRHIIFKVTGLGSHCAKNAISRQSWSRRDVVGTCEAFY